MAFYLRDYSSLLETLAASGYSFGTVRQYFEGFSAPFIFLRHDVDRFAVRSVEMARIEHAKGIHSTYYFRCHGETSFPEAQIQTIRSLGHEIGYHYETLRKAKGRPDAAITLFKDELGALRKLAEIKTIAAHGSPFSRFDNTQQNPCIDFDNLELFGESTLDFDFSRVLYITDTGGIFGSRFNRRDRVDGQNLTEKRSPAELGAYLDPKKHALVLLNTHPERWARNRLGFYQAEITDKFVNIVKFCYFYVS